MKLKKKWAEAHEKAQDRIFTKEPQKGAMFRLHVELYPALRVMLEDPGDKCSLCAKGHWWYLDGAMSHVDGLPHFRQWCLENPGKVRERFPEAAEVLTEATLTEVPV